MGQNRKQASMFNANQGMDHMGLNDHQNNTGWNSWNSLGPLSRGFTNGGGMNSMFSAGQQNNVNQQNNANQGPFNLQPKIQGNEAIMQSQEQLNNNNLKEVRGMLVQFPSLGKYAAQDNSKDQRSSTGEDNGISFTTRDEDHATGTDAWESLSKFMKTGREKQAIWPLGSKKEDTGPAIPEDKWLDEDRPAYFNSLGYTDIEPDGAGNYFMRDASGNETFFDHETNRIEEDSHRSKRTPEESAISLRDETSYQKQGVDKYVKEAGWRDWLPPLPSIKGLAGSAVGGTTGALLGASGAAGATIGGLHGLLSDPGEDEEGERRSRLWRALKGLVGGSALGVAGAGAGLAGGALGGTLGALGGYSLGDNFFNTTPIKKAIDKYATERQVRAANVDKYMKPQPPPLLKRQTAALPIPTPAQIPIPQAPPVAKTPSLQPAPTSVPKQVTFPGPGGLSAADQQEYNQAISGFGGRSRSEMSPQDQQEFDQAISGFRGRSTPFQPAAPAAPRTRADLSPQDQQEYDQATSGFTRPRAEMSPQDQQEFDQAGAPFGIKGGVDKYARAPLPTPRTNEHGFTNRQVRANVDNSATQEQLLNAHKATPQGSGAGMSTPSGSHFYAGSRQGIPRNLDFAKEVAHQSRNIGQFIGGAPSALSNALVSMLSKAVGGKGAAGRHPLRPVPMANDFKNTGPGWSDDHELTHADPYPKPPFQGPGVPLDKGGIDKYAKQPADQTPRHHCHGVHPDQTHEEWKASLEKESAQYQLKEAGCTPFQAGFFGNLMDKNVHFSLYPEAVEKCGALVGDDFVAELYDIDVEAFTKAAEGRGFGNFGKFWESLANSRVGKALSGKAHTVPTPKPVAPATPVPATPVPATPVPASGGLQASKNVPINTDPIIAAPSNTGNVTPTTVIDAGAPAGKPAQPINVGPGIPEAPVKPTSPDQLVIGKSYEIDMTSQGVTGGSGMNPAEVLEVFPNGTVRVEFPGSKLDGTEGRGTTAIVPFNEVGKPWTAAKPVTLPVDASSVDIATAPAMDAVTSDALGGIEPISLNKNPILATPTSAVQSGKPVPDVPQGGETGFGKDYSQNPLNSDPALPIDVGTNANANGRRGSYLPNDGFEPVDVGTGHRAAEPINVGADPVSGLDLDVETAAANRATDLGEGVETAAPPATDGRPITTSDLDVQSGKPVAERLGSEEVNKAYPEEYEGFGQTESVVDQVRQPATPTQQAAGQQPAGQQPAGQQPAGQPAAGQPAVNKPVPDADKPVVVDDADVPLTADQQTAAADAAKSFNKKVSWAVGTTVVTPLGTATVMALWPDGKDGKTATVKLEDGTVKNVKVPDAGGGGGGAAVGESAGGGAVGDRPAQESGGEGGGEGGGGDLTQQENWLSPYVGGDWGGVGEGINSLSSGVGADFLIDAILGKGQAAKMHPLLKVLMLAGGGMGIGGLLSGKTGLGMGGLAMAILPLLLQAGMSPAQAKKVIESRTPEQLKADFAKLRGIEGTPGTGNPEQLAGIQSLEQAYASGGGFDLKEVEALKNDPMAMQMALQHPERLKMLQSAIAADPDGLGAQMRQLQEAQTGLTSGLKTNTAIAALTTPRNQMYDPPGFEVLTGPNIPGMGMSDSDANILMRLAKQLKLPPPSPPQPNMVPFTKTNADFRAGFSQYAMN